MTQKRLKALQALLTQPTKKAAAQVAGIDEKTLRRYLSEKEFQQAYKEAVSDLVTDATRQAQQALNPALSALREIVESENESAGSRVSAARSLLEYGLRLTELNDILQELETAEGDPDVL